jgi:predicted metal-binding protein
MTDCDKAEGLLRRHGFADFRWLTGDHVPVRQWVRFKCRFGCPNYGQHATCPPAVPDIAACREFFAEYRHIAVIRLSVRLAAAEDEKAWGRATALELLKLERALFLGGFAKAFALFTGPCRLCESCVDSRAACRRPSEARPSPEALGVDLFAAARLAGYRLEVLTDPGQTMNRFAFLLLT